MSITVVLGSTQHGKSTLISHLGPFTNGVSPTIGNSVNPCTSQSTLYWGKTEAFLDTCGLDDFKDDSNLLDLAQALSPAFGFRPQSFTIPIIVHKYGIPWNASIEKGVKQYVEFCPNLFSLGSAVLFFSCVPQFKSLAKQEKAETYLADMTRFYQTVLQTTKLLVHWGDFDEENTEFVEGIKADIRRSPKRDLSIVSFRKPFSIRKADDLKISQELAFLGGGQDALIKEHPEHAAILKSLRGACSVDHNAARLFARFVQQTIDTNVSLEEARAEFVSLEGFKQRIK